MKHPVYKDEFCSGCEDFTVMHEIDTHFPEFHSATLKCLSCGCLTHVTEADHAEVSEGK